MRLSLCTDFRILRSLLLVTLSDSYSDSSNLSIKIWNLEDPPVKHAISQSNLQPRRPGNRAFPTYTQQLPIFSTTQVHDDYVDSVRWVGNCLLSKSTKNKVSLWTPDSGRYKVMLLLVLLADHALILVESAIFTVVSFVLCVLYRLCCA
jgi:WD40 repeat protein